MKIIEPSATIETPFNGDEILKFLERCGRVCYKSECKITPDSAKKFVSTLLKSKHESVIEHFSFTVRFICDRGVSHEIVRHRLASYSQESTRYCDYGKSGEIQVIKPIGLKDEKALCLWETAIEEAEYAYTTLRELGISPQIARSVLPNALKTELVMTANLREWRHFFRMRCAPDAHPQMRQITIPLLKECRQMLPVIFEEGLQIKGVDYD